MRRKWAAALIAAFLAVPLAIQLARGGRALAVETSGVARHALKPSVLAAGNLGYNSQVNLTAEIVGRVREILVAEGDVVRKGKVLMRLDPEVYRAEVALQEAAVRQSTLAIERGDSNAHYQEARLERYERLRAQGMVSAVQYDDFRHQSRLAALELLDARQALELARARLHQAREQLAKTDIVAPVDGTVTAIRIRVGETAVPSVNNIAGSELATIGDTSGRYAELNVDETDIDRIAVGQEAKVFPAGSDEPMDATVADIAITPKARAQGRTYAVRLRIDDRAAGFRPGMSCRAEIFTRAAEAVLAVPQQAVLGAEPDASGKAQPYVMVVRGGIATRRPVETGLSDDAYVEVRKGLAEAEVLITGPARALHGLREGQPVTPLAIARHEHADTLARR